MNADADRRLRWIAVMLSIAVHAGFALAPGFPEVAGPAGEPTLLAVAFFEEAPATSPAPPVEASPPVPDAVGPFVPPPVAAPAPADDWAPASVSGAPAAASEPTPETYRPPRLLVGALPLAPEEWDALGVDGEISVPVRLRVAPDGTVDRVEPDGPALDPRLRRAVDRSAAAMRFVPATLDGRPVEAWFTMTFVYRRGS